MYYYSSNKRRHPNCRRHWEFSKRLIIVGGILINVGIRVFQKLKIWIQRNKIYLLLFSVKNNKRKNTNNSVSRHGKKSKISIWPTTTLRKTRVVTVNRILERDPNMNFK